MKSFTITESTQYTKKISKDSIFVDYLRTPFRYGIIGFSLILFVALMIKYFGFLAGTLEVFELGMNEILLSLIGFVFLFLIRFLANYKSGLVEKVTERKIYNSEAA
jgi:hypothetical protein